MVRCPPRSVKLATITGQGVEGESLDYLGGHRLFAFRSSLRLLRTAGWALVCLARAKSRRFASASPPTCRGLALYVEMNAC